MKTIPTVNLKSDRPTVQEALNRLEQELSSARQHGLAILKIIHGYGSTGAGGDIRIAVQLRLKELAETGLLRGCIFGEEWSTSSQQVWTLVRRCPELKSDPDLGKKNLGITIVLL